MSKIPGKGELKVLVAGLGNVHSNTALQNICLIVKSKRGIEIKFFPKIMSTFAIFTFFPLGAIHKGRAAKC